MIMAQLVLEDRDLQGETYLLGPKVKLLKREGDIQYTMESMEIRDYLEKNH